MINLKNIVRSSRRRVIRLRPIEPTRSLEADLYSIYRVITQEWSDFIRLSIAPVYTAPAGIALDATSQDLITLVERKYEDIDRLIVYQTAKLGRWVTRVGEWHTTRTISAAESATGVEIRPYMTMADIRPQLQEAIERNVAMMKSLNADTRKRVEQVIFDSFAKRSNKRQFTKALADAMGITQRAARRIATDQTHKLASVLTELRQVQMGFDEYIWRTRMDELVRHTHRTREGVRFSWSKPPPDGHPGWPVNCRCVAEGYLNLGD